MKLYLDQFLDRDVVDLHFTRCPEEATALLEEQEFVCSSELVFDLQAKKAGSAITVTGRATGDFRYECGRCLSEGTLALDEPVHVVYLSRAAWLSSLEESSDSDEMELSEEDLDVSFYDGDDIVLDEDLRETVLLALPTYAHCPEDLQESCDEAYRKLVEEANLDGEKIKELEETHIDERWSALKELKEKMFSGQE